jgi:hypothetical protein
MTKSVRELGLWSGRQSGLAGPVRLGRGHCEVGRLEHDAVVRIGANNIVARPREPSPVSMPGEITASEHLCFAMADHPE